MPFLVWIRPRSGRLQGFRSSSAWWTSVKPARNSSSFQKNASLQDAASGLTKNDPHRRRRGSRALTNGGHDNHRRLSRLLVILFVVDLGHIGVDHVVLLRVFSSR